MTDGLGKRSGAPDYRQLLDAFDCSGRRPAECVQYLVAKGYTVGQARNAVYRYRRSGRDTFVGGSEASED